MRVSFAGGGSDLAAFYRNHGEGAVVSSAIQQYMYIVIHPYFQDKIRIKYSKTEDVDSIDDIKHPIVRECLKKVKINHGIEIASFADISAGTGLGSSSAFTVGLLHALYAYNNVSISKHQLASEACEIEIEKLGEPIGKQDQYAAAFGDLCHYRFCSDEKVEVLNLPIDQSRCEALERSLKLYYVGGERMAHDILAEQKKNLEDDKEKHEIMKKMFTLTKDVRQCIESGSITELGSWLDQGWQLKRNIASGVSNSRIDELYEKAKSIGCSGGKLLGAGGTGFLLLQSDHHAELEKNLACRTLPFKIDFEGSKVLYREGPSK